MKKAPAPWTLHGKGYVLLYRFSRDFVDRQGRVPDFLQGSFAGGFGSVMLVDYADSNVGPYGEMLFIPGKFRHEERKLHTISQIYVSSMDSVVNGRENWGIPKQLADFRFEELGAGQERITVTVEEKKAAQWTMHAFGPAFPLNTALLPFPLVQLHDGSYFYTRFTGKGKGRLARIGELSIDGGLFPDISAVKPFAVIKVDPFEITFPVPGIRPVISPS